MDVMNFFLLDQAASGLHNSYTYYCNLFDASKLVRTTASRSDKRSRSQYSGEEIVCVGLH